MLNRLKQRKSEGFTIIEVMIVLAIAGLILLIVFLAVPALQRNSRNTTAKNDAAAVAATINEFEDNNDGSLPTSVTAASGTVTAAGTTPATGKVQGSTAVTSPTGGTAPATVAGGSVIVHLKFKCAAAGATETGNSRAVAVYYAVEQASGSPVAKCLDN